MKTILIEFIFIFSIAILAFFAGVELGHEQNTLTLQFMPELNSNGYFLSHNSSVGVFFPVLEEYCIQTKNRTSEQIARTEIHEKCHALVHIDPEHFCNLMADSTKYNEYLIKIV